MSCLWVNPLFIRCRANEFQPWTTSWFFFFLCIARLPSSNFLFVSNWINFLGYFFRVWISYQRVFPQWGRNRRTFNYTLDCGKHWKLWFYYQFTGHAIYNKIWSTRSEKIHIDVIYFTEIKIFFQCTVT